MTKSGCCYILPRNASAIVMGNIAAMLAGDMGVLEYILRQEQLVEEAGTSINCRWASMAECIDEALQTDAEL